MAIEYTYSNPAEELIPASGCPRYDTKNEMGNEKYTFISIAPMSTLAHSNITWKGPIYGSNKMILNKWLMLNWIVGNKTAWSFSGV